MSAVPIGPCPAQGGCAAAPDAVDALSGDDEVRGREGQEALAGGRDADIFIFKTGGGSDRITDFDSAEVLRLDRGLWAADGELSRTAVIAEFASVVAGDLAFRFDGGEVIRLDGVMAVTAFDLQISQTRGAVHRLLCRAPRTGGPGDRPRITSPARSGSRSASAAARSA